MAEPPTIESYQFGKIVIDGTTYNEDVIVLPEGVRAHWWRDKGHVLQPQDLEAVIEAEPEVLIVGQGAYGRMSVTSETRRFLEDAGIDLVAAPTDEAIKRYNDVREQQEAAAALHLTC